MTVEVSTLSLGPERRGGEGIVQRVSGPNAWSSFCAKTFTRATDASTWSKLHYQIQHVPRETETKRFRLAWPEQILMSRGRPIGFLMRAAHEPHVELSALTRQHVDKDKDARFRKFDLSEKGALLNRVRLCTNICAALNMLYTGGEYNILDFKPENVLVTADGRVTLVDLDSVQIRDKGRIIHPGLAGTEGYKPPEGASIDPPDSVKDLYWDAFSLAVVLYQVLVGAPPFAGTFKPPYDNCHELDERVRAGLFVYGDRAKYLKLRPKLHDTFNALSPEIQTLFKRAFSLGDRLKRPTVSEWGSALARFSGAGSAAANFKPVALPKVKSAAGLSSVGPTIPRARPTLAVVAPPAPLAGSRAPLPSSGSKPWQWIVGILVLLWIISSFRSCTTAPSVQPSSQSPQQPQAEASMPPDVAASATSTVYETSFDCSKATGWAEQQICSSESLAGSDRQLATLYSSALSRAMAPDKADLRASQRSWLKGRNGCADVTCIEQAFSERISYLQNWTPTPEPTAEVSSDNDRLPSPSQRQDAVPAGTITCILPYGQEMRATESECERVGGSVYR